jgi:hypothetical protein
MHPPPRRNVRTASYRELFERLPERIQRLAEQAFQMFLANPNHPSLRRHILADNDRGQHRTHSISVSINMQYRAIYVEDGDTNVWYWVGSHADYNRFIGAG